MPRSYPPEFRRKVLELLKAGRSVSGAGLCVDGYSQGDVFCGRFNGVVRKIVSPGSSGSPVYSMTDNGGVQAEGVTARFRYYQERDEAGNPTGPAMPEDSCYTPIQAIEDAARVLLHVYT